MPLSLWFTIVMLNYCSCRFVFVLCMLFAFVVVVVVAVGGDGFNCLDLEERKTIGYIRYICVFGLSEKSVKPEVGLVFA